MIKSDDLFFISVLRLAAYFISLSYLTMSDNPIKLAWPKNVP